MDYLLNLDVSFGENDNAQSLKDLALMTAQTAVLEL